MHKYHDVLLTNSYQLSPEIMLSSEYKNLSLTEDYGAICSESIKKLDLADPWKKQDMSQFLNPIDNPKPYVISGVVG